MIKVENTQNIKRIIEIIIEILLTEFTFQPLKGIRVKLLFL
jgi:hypothetical protein